MKKLPESQDRLLLRTDFSDEATWTVVRDAAQAKTVEGFQAWLHCVSDPSYDGLTVEQLVELASQGCDHTFAFLVDRRTLTDPEHPILIVDLFGDEDEQPGRTFRVIPSQMPSVENNLRLANMGWEEYDPGDKGDGVFRGFPKRSSRRS